MSIRDNLKSVSNVRYNENSDYFEVKKEGTWEETPIKVGLAKQYLFYANNNAANFAAYSGNTNTDTITAKAPTMALGQQLTTVFDATNSNLVAGCIISDLIDVTNYSKIVLLHESTATGTSGWEWAKLFVVSEKASKMTSLAKTTILQSQTSSSGVVELDISGISGQVYIGIELCANNKITTVNVEEMYLE